MMMIPQKRKSWPLSQPEKRTQVLALQEATIHSIELDLSCRANQNEWLQHVLNGQVFAFVVVASMVVVAFVLLFSNSATVLSYPDEPHGRSLGNALEPNYPDTLIGSLYGDSGFDARSASWALVDTGLDTLTVAYSDSEHGSTLDDRSSGALYNDPGIDAWSASWALDENGLDTPPVSRSDSEDDQQQLLLYDRLEDVLFYIASLAAIPMVAGAACFLKNARAKDKAKRPADPPLRPASLGSAHGSGTYADCGGLGLQNAHTRKCRPTTMRKTSPSEDVDIAQGVGACAKARFSEAGLGDGSCSDITNLMREVRPSTLVKAGGSDEAGSAEGVGASLKDAHTVYHAVTSLSNANRLSEARPGKLVVSSQSNDVGGEQRVGSDGVLGGSSVDDDRARRLSGARLASTDAQGVTLQRKRSVRLNEVDSKKRRITKEWDGVWDHKTRCCVCSGLRASKGNDLALCDGCDRAFHQKCHKPRVVSFGDADWFCAECVRGGHGSSC